jgi:preprotein translocase subunit YajC
MISILAQAAQAAGQAEGQPAGVEGFLGNPLVMIVAICVIFWVLIIRPQKKAQKEQQERLAAMDKGDKVITTAGIHGTVSHIDEKTVSIQVASGVTIKFEKSAIIHVQKQDADK